MSSFFFESLVYGLSCAWNTTWFIIRVAPWQKVYSIVMFAVPTVWLLPRLKKLFSTKTCTAPHVILWSLRKTIWSFMKIFVGSIVVEETIGPRRKIWVGPIVVGKTIGPRRKIWAGVADRHFVIKEFIQSVSCTSGKFAVCIGFIILWAIILTSHTT